MMRRFVPIATLRTPAKAKSRLKAGGANAARGAGGSTRSKCFLTQWRPVPRSSTAQSSSDCSLPVRKPESRRPDSISGQNTTPRTVTHSGRRQAKATATITALPFLIDFSTIPARQVGSYANNHIPADQFAYELKQQADLFGSCLIAPEKNSESGGSCLTTLKMIYKVDEIYRQVPHDRIKESAAQQW